MGKTPYCPSGQRTPKMSEPGREKFIVESDECKWNYLKLHVSDLKREISGFIVLLPPVCVDLISCNSKILCSMNTDSAVIIICIHFNFPVVV
jgi:hypothetical protein